MDEGRGRRHPQRALRPDRRPDQGHLGPAQAPEQRLARERPPRRHRQAKKGRAEGHRRRPGRRRPRRDEPGRAPLPRPQPLHPAGHPRREPVPLRRHRRPGPVDGPRASRRPRQGPPGREQGPPGRRLHPRRPPPRSRPPPRHQGHGHRGDPQRRLPRRPSSLEGPRLALHRRRAALAKTNDLPPEVAKRVVPGLCRQAIEAACMEAIRRRRIGRGEPHGDGGGPARRHHRHQVPRRPCPLRRQGPRRRSPPAPQQGEQGLRRHLPRRERRQPRSPPRRHPRPSYAAPRSSPAGCRPSHDPDRAPRRRPAPPRPTRRQDRRHLAPRRRAPGKTSPRARPRRATGAARASRSTAVATEAPAHLPARPTCPDDGVAGRASHAWSSLTRACHHHPYELPVRAPTSSRAGSTPWPRSWPPPGSKAEPGQWYHSRCLVWHQGVRCGSSTTSSP